MMKSNLIHNENGIVLVTGIICLLLLMILGATAYLLSTTDVFISANYKATEQAFNDAEAGVEFAEALIEAHLRAESYLPGTTSYLPVSGSPQDIPDATDKSSDFSFDLSRMAHIGTNLYQFTSTGNAARNATSVIEATFRRKSVYDYAIFADKNIDLKTGAGVFSYNSKRSGWPIPSHGGTWDIDDTDSSPIGGVSLDDYTYSTHFAMIGSNGDGTVGDRSIEFNTDVYVDGDVKKGQKGNPPNPADIWPSEASVLANEQTSGSIGPLNYEEPQDPQDIANDPDFDNDFADYASWVDNDNGDASLVSGIESGKDLEADPYIVQNDGSITLKGKPGGANYYFGYPKGQGISLEGTDGSGNNQSLTIDASGGPVNIYIVGSLHSENGNDVIIQNTSDTNKITINITEKPGGQTEDILRLNNNTDFNPGGAPNHVVIRTDSDNTIQLDNGNDCRAVIYAPYANVQCNNGGDFFGAVRAAEVELKAGMKLYFDEALKNTDLTHEIEFTSWRQILN